MVVHKRKKSIKFRGHVTHGWGSRKKRRGAGSRGGRGNAGTGKRAGQKKAGMKDRVLGRVGFRAREVRLSQNICTINLGNITYSFLEKAVAQGQAQKEKDHYVLNLNKLGYQKLLGAGDSAGKLKITVERCSQQAEEKIKEAGGEVVLSGGVAEKTTAVAEAALKKAKKEKVKN
ncbi:uL15 family ribosomal protein [Candidatus Woesearchaeota archaeon]|nr:uL15 family ribosomal protein [Candidatus Woesearchaeota archaeon]